MFLAIPILLKVIPARMEPTPSILRTRPSPSVPSSSPPSRLAIPPYFNIGATISLGSDTDLVTAKLENFTTKETVALLENVALSEVAFKDLKKGDYLLTITWVDGASNSITMNFSL